MCNRFFESDVIFVELGPSFISVCKVHIFWEDHNILWNLHLTLFYIVPVKSKVEILQNFVTFSEYMNFRIVIYVVPKPFFMIQKKREKVEPSHKRPVNLHPLF